MKVKRFITILMSLILLIGVLSGCATYRPINNNTGRYYCPVHMVRYSQLGSHGGTKCQKQSSSVLYSQTNVINMDAGAGICNSCGNYGCNGSCKKSSGLALFNFNIQSNVVRGRYWPSRRRLIYYNNVYSGRRINYLGSNWGWGNSRHRRSRSNINWNTGYRGYVR